jgi:uncharacterized protein
MNLPYFAMPYQMADNPFVLPDEGWNKKLWWCQDVFFEGTMRGMFSMLFGAGAFLLISRLEKRSTGLQPADIYYRRTIWLVVFGMVNAFLFAWPGDILFNYGICGLFMFPLRHAKTIWVSLLIVLCISVGTVSSTAVWYMDKNIKEKGLSVLKHEQAGKVLTKKQEKEKKAWEELQEKLDWTKVRQNTETTKKEMQKGYWDIVGTLAPYNVKFESIVLYKEYFWDAMAFMLIGLLLFRIGFLQGSFSIAWYLAVLIIGYGFGITLSIFTTNKMLALQFDSTRYADEFGINLYQIRRLLITMGHLSLLIVLYKWGVLKFLFNWLANVGRMAFSNYLMQSILCGLIFMGYGLGYHGKLSRVEMYLFMLGFWVFQIVFSQIWLRFFRMGPFEWIWRSLTYLEMQPFKK